MEKLIILGAGGHAKVIVDILLQNKQYEIVGLISNSIGDGFWGIDVIGSDEDLETIYNQGITNAFVAVGSNKLREKITKKLDEIGYKIINVVSQNAVISPHASLADGIAIMPGAIINADTYIGRGCIINSKASVDHDCRIENFTHIAPGCTIAGSVLVGEGCFLGIGCKVIPQTKIGSLTILGAGAVAICDIPSDSVYIGVPARELKQRL